MRQGKAASILFLYLLTITIKFTDVFCHKTISCRSTSFLFVCFIHHFTVCPYVRMSFLLLRLSESKDAFQITRDVILRKYPRWIFRLGTAGVSFLRTTVRHMWTILKCCLLCQMFACMYQSGDCVCVCVLFAVFPATIFFPEQGMLRRVLYRMLNSDQFICV